MPSALVKDSAYHRLIPGATSSLIKESYKVALINEASTFRIFYATASQIPSHQLLFEWCLSFCWNNSTALSLLKLSFYYCTRAIPLSISSLFMYLYLLEGTV